MTASPVDAIVVGGGLTGLAAAIATAQAGLRTVHLAPAAMPDRRTSALMQPSIGYLRDAGLIESPSTLGHPLSRIRIVDATHRLLRAPETLFDAAEAGMDAFGWNIANARLAERFAAVRDGLPGLTSVDQAVTAIADTAPVWTLTLADGQTVSAPLIIGADGKISLVRTANAAFASRERHFDQSALVCDLTLAKPLHNTSVEFHYPNGPFTLVPAGGNRANLVWIDRLDTLKAARSLPAAGFAAALRGKAQGLFGAMAVPTPSVIFPLSTLSVDRAGAHGLLLIGEAAHAFPPIGAQGLNLGLRDVADLAGALRSSDRTSPDWALRLSQDYANRRAADMGRTGLMVDTLFRSLLAQMLPAQALRAGGLWALKLSPSLRKQAFALGMGQR